MLLEQIKGWEIPGFFNSHCSTGAKLFPHGNVGPGWKSRLTAVPTVRRGLTTTGDRYERQVCQGLNSHYFHIIGDGHQPTSRGLYTHYKDSY